MYCNQFKSNVFAFSEKTLEKDTYQAAEHHVSTCISCSRLLSEYKVLADIMEQEKNAGPNPFAATRILQRIENEFYKPKGLTSKAWMRVLQPVAITFALMTGILIGSYTARQDQTPVNKMASTSENIEFLRSNLFISDFADEDKLLVLNK